MALFFSIDRYNLGCIRQNYKSLYLHNLQVILSSVGIVLYTKFPSFQEPKSTLAHLKNQFLVKSSEIVKLC